MPHVALSSSRIRATKRHVPTVLALVVLIGAGVGACAELDAQDASNAAKLRRNSADPSGDVPIPQVSASSGVPTDDEPLIELTSVDSPRRSRRSQSPSAGSVQAPTPPAPTADEPVAIATPAAPDVTLAATSPALTTTVAPVPSLEPQTPARVEPSMVFEMTSVIVPAVPQVSPTSTEIPSGASVVSETSHPSVGFACMTPARTTTDWLPRRPRLDATAWSVLGVYPLFPPVMTDSTAATPIAASIDESPVPTLPTPIAVVHHPLPIADPSVAKTLPPGTQPAPVSVSLSSHATAPEPLHAPAPLASERPLKPVIVDVAAPLTLPSCIMQRPAPSVTHAAAPTLPPPPASGVQIATSSKTAAPASSPLVPMLLLAATGLAALGTIGVSFIVARSVSAEGTARRSLNIASRIAIAFGVVSVVILGSCWYGSSVAASLGSQITFCIFGAAAAALSVVGGLWIARSVITPLATCVAFMRSLAAGNLMLSPLNFTMRNEIGDLARATDKLGAAMKDLVSELSISSSEVAAAAHELATGAQGMAAAAGQLSSQCSVAVGDASATGRLATSGGRSVQQANDEIARLDSFVRERTDEVSELAERNKHIARIVQLIDDISDRTHLVALNASIEASKAGPNARAFSVLADEVRRLAERSLKAVEEATATVRAVQDDTRSAAEKMSFAALQIKQGADMADRASHDLAEIIKTSGGVTTSIQTITEAAEEAGAGAAQSASAAAQLCSRADDLKAMVSRYRIDTSGFMRHARSPSAPAAETPSAKAA